MALSPLGRILHPAYDRDDILKVYPDSKLALRKLVDYYNSTKEKDEEEVLDIWKKLVQVDYEEAEMAKHIAEKFEKDYNESHKDSDKQLAIEYYTKAMNRYIAKQMEENIDILWNKLVELRSDDIDFFYHLEKKQRALYIFKYQLMRLL